MRLIKVRWSFLSERDDGLVAGHASKAHGSTFANTYRTWDDTY